MSDASLTPTEHVTLITIVGLHGVDHFTQAIGALASPLGLEFVGSPFTRTSQNGTETVQLLKGDASRASVESNLKGRYAGSVFKIVSTPCALHIQNQGSLTLATIFLA